MTTNFKLSDHPFVAIIREYLKQGGIDPDSIEERRGTVEEQGVTYKFLYPEGFQASFSIYLVGQEVFSWFEIAISFVDSCQEKEIHRFLLNHQADFFYPTRLVIKDEIIRTQFRSYCDGITTDGIKTRLHTMFAIANETYNLLKENFDLKPYFHSSEGQEVH